MEDSNRGRILAAATELFNTRGYRNVTIKDLAEKLGMSKKTLYLYFPGKEEIATVVVENILAKIGRRFEEADFSQDPLGVLRNTLEQIKSELVRFRPLFFEDVQKLLPKLWTRILEFRAQKIMTMERVIQEAQQAGRAKPVNAHLATLFFLEAVQAIMNPISLSHYGYSISEMFDTIAEIFLGGIALPGTPDISNPDISNEQLPAQEQWPPASHKP